VLVSDTCSTCTEKVEIVSLNAARLSDSCMNLQISASTNEEQSEFISRLRATRTITSSIQKRGSNSPFLLGSGAVTKEAINCLHSLGVQEETAPAIKSEHEVADHPDKLRDELLVFLSEREGFVTGLNQSRQRISESSQLMIAAIQRRYPIKHNELRATAEFGWKVPVVKPEYWEKLLLPADGLISGLQLEVKPDLDGIERESRTEKERVEQTASLERKRTEQTYSVELSSLKRETELRLKRLESQQTSLEGQVKLRKSEYRDAKAALEEAKDEFDESTQSDSVQTSEMLEEKVDRLERTKDERTRKLDDAEQALKMVESEISDANQEYERGVASMQHNKSLALDEQDAKLKTAIGTVEEKRRRSVDERLTNVVLVQQERGVLEEIANKSLAYDEEDLGARETVELEDLWHDETLLHQKTEAIKDLETTICGRIDDALRSIERTNKFLGEHAIRTNDATPSTTVEILIPLWYVEIASQSEGREVVETHVISPSEIALGKLDEKAKSLLGVAFLPILPAVASAVDSIKSYNYVQSCARLSNQVQGLDPGQLLPENHWIVRSGFIAKKFYESFQKDFKKRSKN